MFDPRKALLGWYNEDKRLFANHVIEVYPDFNPDKGDLLDTEEKQWNVLLSIFEENLLQRITGKEKCIQCRKNYIKLCDKDCVQWRIESRDKIYSNAELFD